MKTYKDLKKQISKFSEVEFYRFLDDIFNSKRIEKNFNLTNDKLNVALTWHRQEINNVAFDIKQSKYKTKLFEFKLEYLHDNSRDCEKLCGDNEIRDVSLNYTSDKDKYWYRNEQKYLTKIRKLNAPIIKTAKYKIGDIIFIQNGYESEHCISIHKHINYISYNTELELEIVSIDVDDDGVLYYNTIRVNRSLDILKIYEYHISDPTNKIIRKTNIKNILK